jgi:uncharacterized protein YndB with AHSA1/START domain
MAEAPVPEGETRIGITITRTFDAPRELVWREWTEPERFADWFGGSESEVPIASVTMDVTPGGSLRLTMIVAAGSHVIEWKGQYIEVEPPERLVFTIRDQPGEGPYEEIIVVLTDLGDGRTEMRLQQRGSTSASRWRARPGRAGDVSQVAGRLCRPRRSRPRSGSRPAIPRDARGRAGHRAW